MSGESIIADNAGWIKATARKLAYSFKEPEEDCSQTLALHLLKGESRLGAQQRTIRELLRAQKWHSVNHTCSALGLDVGSVSPSYGASADLADFIDVALSEQEQVALSLACFSLDQHTIANCMECSQDTVSRLLMSIKAKLREELYG